MTAADARAYFERGFIAAAAWSMTKRADAQLSDAVIDHAWDHRDEGMAEADHLPALADTASGECGAKPDHADIMETIQNAADDWQKNGYTSALAEIRDMANVGRSLMEALPKGYCYMDCPSEIVSDLQNELDEVRQSLTARESATADVGRKARARAALAVACDFAGLRASAGHLRAGGWPVLSSEPAIRAMLAFADDEAALSRAAPSSDPCGYCGRDTCRCHATDQCQAPGCDNATTDGICDACDQWVSDQVAPSSKLAIAELPPMAVTTAMVDAGRKAIADRYYAGGKVVQMTSVYPSELATLVLEAALAITSSEDLLPAQPRALAGSIAEIEAWDRAGISLSEIENEVSFTESVCLVLHELKRLRAMTHDGIPAGDA